MNEYKKDINDLLLDGVKIADRIETREAGYFSDIAVSLEAIQKAQQSNKKETVLTREELKRDDQAYEQYKSRNQYQEQER